MQVFKFYFTCTAGFNGIKPIAIITFWAVGLQKKT